MNRLTKALILTSACLFLFGCGQRGPLVMPKPANETSNQEQSEAETLNTQEASDIEASSEEQSS
jgi:predicted small lipoprotein YifL